MTVTGIVIAVLLTAILVLEIVKITYRKSLHPVNELDVGSCMTIGDREVQEDCSSMLTTDAGTLAVLADGAGKMYGGRIASRIAVNTCVEIFKDYNAFNNPQYYFRKAFHTANKEILKELQEENRGNASIACALIRSGYLYYALVGNVQLAVFREGNLIPVSVGHTVAVLSEQKFREGKLARKEAQELLANQRLYNYLGRDDFKDIEYFDAPIRLREGDIVVLMSDGVYDLIGYQEVEDVLEKTSNCQKKALEIIEKVNHYTGISKDNASIVLVAMGNGAAQ